MNMRAVNVNVDPTAPRPWYADLFEQGAAILQSEQIRRINRDRLAAGLPPLTEAQARSLAPTANVRVAVPEEVKPLIWIAGGAIIVLTLAALSRGR